MYIKMILGIITAFLMAGPVFGEDEVLLPILLTLEGAPSGGVITFHNDDTNADIVTVNTVSGESINDILTNIEAAIIAANKSELKVEANAVSGATLTYHENVVSLSTTDAGLTMTCSRIPFKSHVGQQYKIPGTAVGNGQIKVFKNTTSATPTPVYTITLAANDGPEEIAAKFIAANAAKPVLGDKESFQMGFWNEYFITSSDTGVTIQDNLLTHSYVNQNGKTTINWTVTDGNQHVIIEVNARIVAYVNASDGTYEFEYDKIDTLSGKEDTDIPDYLPNNIFHIRSVDSNSMGVRKLIGTVPLPQ